jgi:bacteriorhodopsin
MGSSSCDLDPISPRRFLFFGVGTCGLRVRCMYIFDRWFSKIKELVLTFDKMFKNS